MQSPISLILIFYTFAPHQLFVNFYPMLSKTLFLLFFTMLVSCAHNEQKSQKQAKYLLEIGTSYLANGDSPQAIRHLRQSLVVDPENPVTYNNLALAYYFKQKYTLAEENLKIALKLEPKYTEAMNNYGRVLIELGQYQQAASILLKATNDLTYSMPEKSYSNLGYAYYKNKQYQDAYLNLKKSLSIRKNNCFTNTTYAHTLYAQKKYQTSADSFFRNIHLCENQKDLVQENKYNAALAFLQVNKYNQAVALLEEIQSDRSIENESWQKSAHDLLKTLKR